MCSCFHEFLWRVCSCFTHKGHWVQSDALRTCALMSQCTAISINAPCSPLSVSTVHCCLLQYPDINKLYIFPNSWNMLAMLLSMRATPNVAYTLCTTQDTWPPAISVKNTIGKQALCQDIWVLKLISDFRMFLFLPLLLLVQEASCGHFLFWLPMRFDKKQISSFWLSSQSQEC